MAETESRVRAGLVARCADACTSALHHDFCPWANRYVYWLKQPIGWFAAGAFAAALVAITLAPQVWLAFAAIAIVTAAGVAWPWISLWGVSAELEFDRRRCREHDEFELRLRVKNRWPWPAWGVLLESRFLRESAADAIEAPAPAAALAQVAGWSCSEYRWTLSAAQRGVIPYAAPRLSTAFPFGLWYAFRPVTCVQELIVWPRTVPLAGMPRVVGRESVLPAVLANQEGDEGDLLAARPYREGDSLRRVHWAHTARRDALIVCQRQASTTGKAAVVLHCESFRQAHEADRAHFEWGVRTLASLIRNLHSHGYEIDCRLGAEIISVKPAGQYLQACLDRLARFEPAAFGNCDEPSVNCDYTLLIRYEPAERAASSTGAPPGDPLLAPQGGSRRSPPRTAAIVISGSSRRTDVRVNRLRCAEAMHGLQLRMELARDFERQLQMQWERNADVDVA